jgi:hypothetical protein
VAYKPGFGFMLGLQVVSLLWSIIVSICAEGRKLKFDRDKSEKDWLLP